MTNKPTMNSTEINFYLCLQCITIKNSSAVKVFKDANSRKCIFLQKGDALQVRYICRSITDEGKLKMYKHCSHRRKYNYHRSQVRFKGWQKNILPVDCATVIEIGKLRESCEIVQHFAVWGSSLRWNERHTGSIRVWFGDRVNLFRWGWVRFTVPIMTITCHGSF